MLYCQQSHPKIKMALLVIRLKNLNMINVNLLEKTLLLYKPVKIFIPMHSYNTNEINKKF
jgi:hypothetical protein